MKPTLLSLPCLIAFSGFFTTALPALAQDASTGTVVMVAGDPGDFVTQLDVNGRCGSPYFHSQRANANFKEMVAVALTAFTTGRRMTFFVTGCAGDRNITSHGYVTRD